MTQMSCAALVCAVCASACFAGSPLIGTRLLGPDGQTDTIFASPPDSDGWIHVDMTFQVQVLNDPNADAVGSLQAGFNDRGDDGMFSPGPLTFFEGTGLDMPGPDPLGRTGMFPRYRVFIGDNNDGPGNGRPDTRISRPDGSREVVDWEITAPALAPAPEFIGAEWGSVYKLRWSTDDLTPRNVDIDQLGSLGGYYIGNTFIQPVPLTDFTMRIVIPTPASGSALVLATTVLAIRRRRTEQRAR